MLTFTPKINLWIKLWHAILLYLLKIKFVNLNFDKVYKVWLLFYKCFTDMMMVKLMTQIHVCMYPILPFRFPGGRVILNTEKHVEVYKCQKYSWTCIPYKLLSFSPKQIQSTTDPQNIKYTKCNIIPPILIAFFFFRVKPFLNYYAETFKHVY